jgi:hypothetical protein
MIQYRSYNVASPLNHEAARWAEQNTARFPTDKRDLLGGSEHARPLVLLGSGDEDTALGRTVEGLVEIL